MRFELITLPSDLFGTLVSVSTAAEFEHVLKSPKTPPKIVMPKKRSQT